jgi:hypothetical protein
MLYIKDIPTADHNRAMIYFDMQGIFHYSYCKPGAPTFARFYKKRFYYSNKHGLYYVKHNGRHYYCPYQLQYS